MSLPPEPKFEKSMHHVVPAFWQRRFTSRGDPGPYYKNILSNKNFDAQGPGSKMAEEYVNIVFDDFFRPSDDLENELSKLETKFANGLNNLIQNKEITDTSRVDLAMLLAVQTCRYPDFFRSRLDLGKYLAIAIVDFRTCPDVQSLNNALASTGMLPGAKLNNEDFERLQSADVTKLECELEAILDAHGYESYFNPELIIAASMPVAEHLLGLEWKLLQTKSSGFILSDRPVPSQTRYGFSVGLSANYGLTLSKPTQPVQAGTISPQAATQSEVDAVNNEVKSRAHEWICGPGSWVHNL